MGYKKRQLNILVEWSFHAHLDTFGSQNLVLLQLTSKHIFCEFHETNLRHDLHLSSWLWITNLYLGSVYCHIVVDMTSMGNSRIFLPLFVYDYNFYCLKEVTEFSKKLIANLS